MEETYTQAIQNALTKASLYDSKLSNEIFLLDGMSGYMTRCFYNNLCSMNDVRYLEIGSWKGSTLCSAMYKNPHGTFLAIENFSEFHGPREEFLRNMDTFKYGNVSFLERDCFSVDTTTIPQKFNIFMYDGNHEYASHYRVLSHYLDLFDDLFIYIVDDYNWPFVREATEKSIQDCKCTVLYEHIKRTSFNDQYPTDDDLMKKTFWNGMYVALLSKQRQV